MNKYWRLYTVFWATVIGLSLLLIYRASLPRYDAFATAELTECHEHDTKEAFSFISTYVYYAGSEKLEIKSGSRISCRPLGTRQTINYNSKKPADYDIDYDPHAFRHSDGLFFLIVSFVVMGGISALMIAYKK